MAEKKKILYIVEAMGGGVFTYIVDLANELVNGGAVMNSLMVTYMWVQMGYPTGVCGVRSQHLHETK